LRAAKNLDKKATGEGKGGQKRRSVYRIICGINKKGRSSKVPSPINESVQLNNNLGSIIIKTSLCST